MIHWRQGYYVSLPGRDMRGIHRALFIITAVLLTAISFTGCIQHEPVDISKDWQVCFTDNWQCRLPEFDPTELANVNMPARLYREEKKQAVWIRKEFTVPVHLRNREIAVFLGKIIEVDHTYLNGKKIGISGREDPDFYSGWNINRLYYLPPALLNDGGTNLLSVRVFAEMRPRTQNRILLGTLKDLQIHAFKKTMLAKYIPMGTGFITLFLGVVFLISFIRNPENSVSLFFSIISILWFISTFHYYLPHFGIDYHLQDIMYYSMLSIIVLLLYFFMEVFLEIRLKVVEIVISILGLAAVLLAATSTQASPLTGWRMLVIASIGIISQVMWGILIVTAVLRKNREARVILIAYMFFLFCLVLDVLTRFGIIDLDFVWIILGYPAMLISFAIVIIGRVGMMAETLRISSAELEERNETLHNIFKRVKSSVNELTGFSVTVRNTATELQDKMSNQGETLEGTSAAVEEISASIDNIALTSKGQDEFVQKNAVYLLKYLNYTNQITTAAKNAVKLSYRSMGLTDDSRKKLDEIVEGMLRIREASSSIIEISEMINDIAEQTNLLSLNASIEAARAGTSGRGFAVVAEEIGKLADRSMQQSKTIQSIINETVNDIENEMQIIQNSADAIAYVEKGVRQVGTAIDEIVDLCVQQETLTVDVRQNLEDIKSGSSDVSTATAEQSQSMQEILDAIDGLNSIMNDVMDHSRSLTDSLENLTDQIVTLKQVME